MECTKCKLQYVDKAEVELNLRINNNPEVKCSSSKLTFGTKRSRF